MARRVGAGVIVAALAAAMLAFVVQLRRAELNLNDVVAPAATGASSSTSLSITAQSITAAIHATAAVARGPASTSCGRAPWATLSLPPIGP